MTFPAGERIFAWFRLSASLPLIIPALIVHLFSSPCAADHVARHSGKWTGLVDWSNAAVHLALLPGDSTTSDVVWWLDFEHDPLLTWTAPWGGVWRWTPGVDDSINSG